MSKGARGPPTRRGGLPNVCNPPSSGHGISDALRPTSCWKQGGWPHIPGLSPQGPPANTPASLPLLYVSVHFRVCPSLETSGPVPPQSTSQTPSSPGALRPGLGTHLIRCLQLGIKLAEDLLQVLADDVSQHVQPAPGARGAGLSPGSEAFPVGPCSLPTGDLSGSAWSLGPTPSPGSPKEAQPSHPVSVYKACEYPGQPVPAPPPRHPYTSLTQEALMSREPPASCNAHPPHPKVEPNPVPWSQSADASQWLKLPPTPAQQHVGAGQRRNWTDPKPGVTRGPAQRS